MNPRRSNTPISPDGEENTIDNLSALEFVLNVATISQSQLPDLGPISHSELEAIGHAPMPTDDDTTSSVQDSPALPCGQPKVRFLPSQSGGDSSAEDTSQVDAFELYGRKPVDLETGTDGVDEFESGVSIRQRESEWTKGPAVPIEADGLPQLSGRSRALLKRYL